MLPPDPNVVLVVKEGGKALKLVLQDLSNRFCVPVIAELRDFALDEIATRRQATAIKQLQRAIELDDLIGKTRWANPRVFAELVDKGSWVDDPKLQEMWAGLTASSCSETGADQTNRRFLQILDQMSALDAKVLEFFVKHYTHYLDEGTIVPQPILVSTVGLKEHAGVADIDEVVLSINSLHHFGLLHGGSGVRPSGLGNYALSDFALQFYVRCLGKREGVVEYFSEIDIRNRSRPIPQQSTEPPS